MNPTVHASSTDSLQAGEIITGENFALYNYEDARHRYIIFLDFPSGIGHFSIRYVKEPDYIYEYSFTASPSETNLQSTLYWSAIITDCFSNSDTWQPIYIPESYSVAEITDNSAQLYATDSFQAELQQQMYDMIESAPHTGRVVATSYKGSLIFHVFEDLTYVASPYNTITLSDAISISSFIISVLTFNPSQSLVSLISIGFGVAGIIPKGTTIKTYLVCAKWDRYVKRKDSSIWLTEATQHIISCYGYVNPSSGFCELDDGTISDDYYPSQSYFEDLNGQLDRGYAYYLTL